MRGKLLRTVAWAALVGLAVGACPASAAGQSVTIAVQPDSVFRLFATYRSVSGSASSSTPVSVTSTDSACQVSPVPGTSRGRYVYVRGTADGSCGIVARATVSGRVWQASIVVQSAQVTRYAITLGATPPPPPPPPPPANAAPVSRPTVSCTGNTCTFDGRGSSDDQAVVSWTWWDGNPANPISTAATFTHPPLSGTAAAPRTRVWKLTVRDAAGLSHTDSVVFTVPSTAPPAPPPPPPSVDSTPPLPPGVVTMGAVPFGSDSVRITVGWTVPGDPADSVLVQVGNPDEVRGPPVNAISSGPVSLGASSLTFWSRVRVRPFTLIAQVCRFHGVAACTGAPVAVVP